MNHYESPMADVVRDGLAPKNEHTHKRTHPNSIQPSTKVARKMKKRMIMRFQWQMWIVTD